MRQYSLNFSLLANELGNIVALPLSVLSHDRNNEVGRSDLLPIARNQGNVKTKHKLAINTTSILLISNGPARHTRICAKYQSINETATPLIHLSIAEPPNKRPFHREIRKAHM